MLGASEICPEVTRHGAEVSTGANQQRGFDAVVDTPAAVNMLNVFQRFTRRNTGLTVL